MIVFDIVVGDEVKETLEPVNQRLREMQHFLFDRLEGLKMKYGKFEIYRRYVILSA